MNNPAPKYPCNATVVAGFIAAYYVACGRPVGVDIVDAEPTVTVYESRAEYERFHDTGGTPDAITFAVHASGSGFDIVDATTGTFHARVRSDFDYPAVADAVENGVAFD